MGQKSTVEVSSNLTSSLSDTNFETPSSSLSPDLTTAFSNVSLEANQRAPSSSNKNVTIKELSGSILFTLPPEIRSQIWFHFIPQDAQYIRIEHLMPIQKKRFCDTNFLPQPSVIVFSCAEVPQGFHSAGRMSMFRLPNTATVITGPVLQLSRQIREECLQLLFSRCTVHVMRLDLVRPSAPGMVRLLEHAKEVSLTIRIGIGEPAASHERISAGDLKCKVCAVRVKKLCLQLQVQVSKELRIQQCIFDLRAAQRSNGVLARAVETDVQNCGRYGVCGGLVEELLPAIRMAAVEIFEVEDCSRKKES